MPSERAGRIAAERATGLTVARKEVAGGRAGRQRVLAENDGSSKTSLGSIGPGLLRCGTERDDGYRAECYGRPRGHRRARGNHSERPGDAVGGYGREAQPHPAGSTRNNAWDISEGSSRQ